MKTATRPHWLSCWLSFLAKRPYYVGPDMLNAKNTLSVKKSPRRYIFYSKLHVEISYITSYIFYKVRERLRILLLIFLGVELFEVL